ncbi:MAG: ArsR/SmtB family transcription factor [Candidatus Hydrothermarchaeota archaeon]
MTKELKDNEINEIYSVLSHPLRREVLKLLYEEKLSFSHMLEHLEVEPGTFGHHLKKLDDFLERDENKNYFLSEKGRRAYNIMIGGETEIGVKKAERKEKISEIFSFSNFRSLIDAVTQPTKLFRQIKGNGGMYILPSFVVLLLLAFIGYRLGCVYDGAVDIHSWPNPSLGSVLFQLMLSWFALSIFFYGVPRVVYKKKAEFLDVFSSVGISKIVIVPSAILASYSITKHIINPELMEKLMEISRFSLSDPGKVTQLTAEIMPETIKLSIFGIILISFMIWLFILFVYALREESELETGEAIITVILGGFVAEIVTKLIFLVGGV